MAKEAIVREYMGKSFVARLYGENDRQSFGMVTTMERMTSGRNVWLRLDPRLRRVFEFKFDYLDKSDGCFRYAVTGAESAESHAYTALGVSVNGYLGLYDNGNTDNRWGLQYEEDESSSFFTLLDSNGRRVGLSTIPFLEPGNTPNEVRDSKIIYVNALAKNGARFALESVRVLE